MRTHPAPPSRRGLLLLEAAAAGLLAAAPAAALPVLGSPPPQVSAGGAQPVIQSSGSTVRIDLNAPRTIIDWSSFNLTPGERADFLFDQRNWFVLNRVTGSQISINGQVFAGQAANLNSPLPSGPGGNVWFYSPQGVAFGANARVDVGGMLATSATPNTAEFLNPANINIHFTGSGSGGPVTVAAGARFNATASIAFAAPQVTTAAGSTVTVSDYGSALYLGADSFELQFFPTFNNDLTLFTFIVPNRAAGTLNPAALQIAGQTTSGTIYLAAYSRAALASEIINAPGLLTARSSFAEYGQVTITTGRSVILGQPGANGQTQHHVPGVTTGHVRLGEVNADGNVNVVLVSLDVGAPGVGPGNVNATRIRSGQGLQIVGNIVNIPGGVSSGDAGIAARGGLSIRASGPVNVPTVTAATDLFVGSLFNDFRFDTVTAGGAVTLMTSQGVTGNRVTNSSGTLLINTGGPTNVGTVAGAVVQILSAGAVTVPTVSGTTSVLGGSNTSLDFGSVTAPTFTATSLLVRLGTVSVTGDALVRTPQMDLTTSFTAANLNIEGSGGVFRLGGDGPLGLTNAEVQRIRVTGALNLYAGQTVATTGNPNPAYGAFDVLDVTIDTSRIPRLNLFAHTGQQVNVSGTVNVLGSGGVLRIGDPTAGSAWLPDHIVITGALGTTEGNALSGFANVRGFQTVELNAVHDILIGSSRFIDLIDDASPETIDIARGLPAGVAPQGDEVGRVFLVAGSARLNAGDRILQQNTGAPGQEGGFYLSGVGVSLSEPLLTIGGGPEAVDMFGALAGETGVISGRQASFSRRIAIAGETSGFSSAVRINGCPLGVGCAVSTPSEQFRIDQFQAAAPAPPVDPPLLMPALPKVDEDERETEPVITGSGNEEIWRRDR